MQVRNWDGRKGKNLWGFGSGIESHQVHLDPQHPGLFCILSCPAAPMGLLRLRSQMQRCYIQSYQIGVKYRLRIVFIYFYKIWIHTCYIYQ